MRAVPVYDSIICFGDSLTQQATGPGGFVSALQDVYQRRLDVTSRGFSGYSSRQGLSLCPKLFAPSDITQEPSAKLATVWFGTNDAIRPGFPQHVPVDEFRENMSRILDDHFDQVDVLLITPTTVVVPNSREGHEDDSLHILYGQVLADVARTTNEKRQGQAGTRSSSFKKVVLVNMHALFLEAAQRTPAGLPSLFQEDGMHISAEGYKVVFDGLMAAIRSRLPHLLPDNLPFIVPDWKAIDLAADAQGQSAQLEPKRGR